MDLESSNTLFTVGQESATFLACSGILHKAWEGIHSASINNVPNFVLKEDESVWYVIFPSLYIDDFMVRDSRYGECAIQKENRDFYDWLKGDDDQPALVHKGALNRFLYILSNSDFKAQMQRFMKLTRDQVIVFVGHSIGGAMATLATIWFLQKKVPKSFPFCITFGSPLVGDVRLGEAIGHQDWSGKFCHVVSKYDIVPRMLLAPFEAIAEPLNAILPHWGSIMGNASDPSIHEACRTLFKNVHKYTSTIANNYTGESGHRSPYIPFGTYMFCSTKGAACIEDPEAVLKMLHFTMQSTEDNPFDEGACISEHTRYGYMLEHIFECSLNTTRIASVSEFPFEMGNVLQCEAMGVGAQNDHALLALKKAGEVKNKCDMNITELNDRLSRRQIDMANVEWYKARSKDQGISFYDSFKQLSERRDITVNKFRLNLESFWDEIVEMVEKHELPSDFQSQNKWINAGTAYRKLVEPLDIADYYRRQKDNGSYLSEGVRPHRHIVLEKWMIEKEKTRIGRGKKPRTTFASLTEDSCFWAKLEEANKALTNLQQDQHQVMHAQLKERLEKFEGDVWSMVKDYRISEDVFLEKSSFMIWWQQYRNLQLQSPEWKSSSPLFGFMDKEGWKQKM